MDLHSDTGIIREALPFSQAVLYNKGDSVVLQGEQSRCLYFVGEGSVEVSHTLRDTRIVVALIGPGDFFGEIGFFDRTSRIRDIRATETSLIHIFDQESFLHIRRENPFLYGGLLDLLLRNICEKFRRILTEREPLTAYAASLSTGGRGFDQSAPIPESFFKTSEWQLINKVVEDLKARFYDLTYRLQEDSGVDIPETLKDQCGKLLNRFNDQLQEVQDRLDDPEIMDCSWGYIFKEIFPYFMRSRFAERAYYKPKGYAGDFLMMEMIYRNEPDGDGKLGVLVDGWCLGTAAARAVRGRRLLLKEELSNLVSRKAANGGTVRIMNLACGSSRELFDFLFDCQYSEAIEATCVDADPQALEFASRQVDTCPHRASIRFMNDNVIKWSLGRIRHNYGLQDIIYSTGLTDYLDRRLFLALLSRCYDQLKPDGTLIIGNFGIRNPNRAFMDHVLHWKLIHRPKSELRDLFLNSPFGPDIEVLKEEQGLNLFAVATKRPETRGC